MLHLPHVRCGAVFSYQLSCLVDNVSDCGRMNTETTSQPSPLSSKSITIDRRSSERFFPSGSHQLRQNSKCLSCFNESKQRRLSHPNSSHWLGPSSLRAECFQVSEHDDRWMEYDNFVCYWFKQIVFVGCCHSDEDQATFNTNPSQMKWNHHSERLSLYFLAVCSICPSLTHK